MNRGKKLFAFLLAAVMILAMGMTGLRQTETTGIRQGGCDDHRDHRGSDSDPVSDCKGKLRARR